MPRQSFRFLVAAIVSCVSIYGLVALQPASAVAANHIKVTSLSTTTPYPLTSLTLSVSGLAGSKHVTVQFRSRPTGAFFVSEKPISVSGSSVVVAVPIYATNNGTMSHGNVTLRVLQGGRVSAVRQLAIAPLPTDATYGTKPGEISKYFLNLQAMMLGERINELEAVGAEFGIDTSKAQSVLNEFLDVTLNSMNDVNRIIADPTTVIDGPASSTAPTTRVNLQFIKSMDQVYGVYLLNEFGSSVSAGGAVRPHLFAPTELRVLMGTITTASAVNDAKDIFEQAGNNIWIQAVAVSAGSSAFIHQLSGSKVAGALADGLPIAVAMFNVGLAAENEGFTVLDMMRAAYQGDVPSYAADYEQLKKDSDALMKASTDGLLTGVTAALPLRYQQIIALSTPLVGSESELLHSAAEMMGLAPLDYSTEETFVSVGAAMANNPTPGPKFGLIQGQANIANTAGIGAALDSTQLCCVGSPGVGINGIANPDGGFDLWYPLGIANTNYSSLTLNIYDFITSVQNNPGQPITALSWENLNLSSPTAGQATTAPTLTGTCVDSDWQNPDGDDPDCD